MSQNAHPISNQLDECDIECYINEALGVISGKWSFLILKELFDNGTRRFGELQKSLSQISPKALTDVLRQLEANDIIVRKAYPTVPVTVEYSLTEKGLDLRSTFEEMRAWAIRWRARNGE